MRQRFLLILFLAVCLIAVLPNRNAHSGSFMDKIIDPKDGKFDARSTFDFSRIPIGIDQWEIDFKNVGLGFVI